MVLESNHHLKKRPVDVWEDEVPRRGWETQAAQTLLGVAEVLGSNAKYRETALQAAMTVITESQPSSRLLKQAEGLWMNLAQQLPDTESRFRHAMQGLQAVRFRAPGVLGDFALQLGFENVAAEPNLNRRVGLAARAALFYKSGTKQREKAVDKWGAFVDALPDPQQRIRQAVEASYQYCTPGNLLNVRGAEKWGKLVEALPPDERAAAIRAANKEAHTDSSLQRRSEELMRVWLPGEKPKARSAASLNNIKRRMQM